MSRSGCRAPSGGKVGSLLAGTVLLTAFACQRVPTSHATLAATPIAAPPSVRAADAGRASAPDAVALAWRHEPITRIVSCDLPGEPDGLGEGAVDNFVVLFSWPGLPMRIQAHVGAEAARMPIDTSDPGTTLSPTVETSLCGAPAEHNVVTDPVEGQVEVILTSKTEQARIYWVIPTALRATYSSAEEHFFASCDCPGKPPAGFGPRH